MPRTRKTKARVQLVLNPHAAGADIGAREIYVAVPADATDIPVRRFDTFTEDLRQLVRWLQEHAVTTVAMEATSVYWIPLAELLEEAGIEVCLVNPRHVKNVPGRKTDVADCQWLQYLHSVGLLRAAFRPAASVRAVRALWRHRDVEAILAGQREPAALAALGDKRLKARRPCARRSPATTATSTCFACAKPTRDTPSWCARSQRWTNRSPPCLRPWSRPRRQPRVPRRPTRRLMRKAGRRPSRAPAEPIDINLPTTCAASCCGTSGWI